MQINGTNSSASFIMEIFGKTQNVNKVEAQNSALPQNNSTFASSNGQSATPAVPAPTFFADLNLGGKSFIEASGFDMSRSTFGGDLWNELHKTFANGTYTCPVDTKKAEQIYKTATATNSDGSVVSVTKNAEGDEVSYHLELGGISLDFTGDLRLGKNEEGSYLVYSSESGKTTLYNADGTINTEQDGDATANASHKIYVDTTGAEIQGNDEDELFFILGENTKVTCGAGNDTIVLPANSYGAQIDAGQGNNTITGHNVFDAKITAGDGNNSVNIGRQFDTSLSLGNGNNKAKVGALIGGEFISGDGDNSIHIGGARAANVTIGNGDNIVDMYDLKYNSTLNIGNGNNTVEIYEVGANDTDLADDAYRETGIFVHDIASVGFFGDPEIKALYANKDSSTINMGNGDNYLHIYEVQNNGAVNLGNGNNKAIIAIVKHSEFSIGDGDNTVSIGHLENGSSAQIGNGDNYIVLHQIKDNSSATIGDGDNAIIIGTVSGDGSVTIGDGNNDITIHDLLENAQIFLGDGNNIIEVYRMKDDAIFSLGNGNNSIATHPEFSSDYSFGNIPDDFFEKSINKPYSNSSSDYSAHFVFGSGDNAFYNDWGNRTFEDIRNERKESGLPAILNSGEVFKEAKNSPQAELIDRVRMLSSWNAPKYLSAS